MKRLRVFLVNVGLRTFSNFWVVPPMGIMALASHIREKLDVDVMLVNQRLENCTAEELARRAQEFGADIVGLSVLTTTACLVPDIIQKTRERLPDVFVVLGGPHVFASRAQALETSGADAGVPGEGELSFEQLIREQFDGGDLGNVPGLIWRNPEGEIETNEGISPKVEDIDTLPMPAYDLIDLPAYWRHQTIVPVPWRKYGALFTSRGCHFSCIWCHKIFGKQIRMHSPERVLEEMTYLKKTYGVRDFDFLDDTFNADKERVIQLSELLQKNNVNAKIAIPNGVRGDILTPEVIDAMVDAGLYMCMFALESGSPRIQKLTRKGLNIPRFLEACRLVAKHRVFISSCCMLGFPTETEEELQQTIDVACEAEFHTSSFFTVTPYPGSPLYDMVKETCPEKLDGIDFDMVNSSTIRVNLTDLPDDVFYSYQRKAVRKFYSKPRRIARLIRDHPQRWALPSYGPLLVYRALKGLRAD